MKILQGRSLFYPVFFVDNTLCACFGDYAHTSRIQGALILGVCTSGALQPTANFSEKCRSTYFRRSTYLRGFYGTAIHSSRNQSLKSIKSGRQVPRLSPALSRLCTPTHTGHRDWFGCPGVTAATVWVPWCDSRNRASQYQIEAASWQRRADRMRAE